MPEHLTITREANRVRVVGDVRTPWDREELKEQVGQAISFNLAQDAERHEVQHVVLDVERASYLDSYTLPILDKLARRCVDVGMVLDLEGANPDLLELLRITRIGELLGTLGGTIT